MPTIRLNGRNINQPERLTTIVTSVANGTTVETDLISYTLPAGTLNQDGRAIRITVWGTSLSNANTKAIRIYFGATQVATITGQTTVLFWEGQALVTRVSNTSQSAKGGVTTTAAFVTSLASAPAETLSGAIVIRVTGTSNTASGDITGIGMLVELI